MKRLHLIPAVAALLLTPIACDKGRDSASVIVSRPGSYWQQEAARVLETGSVASPDLTIDEGTTFQPIDGFGGAFNERGWDALLMLDTGTRQRALRLLFDANEGLRFQYGRVPIGASDYALDRYTLDDVPGDYALRHFSIDRDRLLMIPYIRAALAHQPKLRIWASAWTPPPWMKTNNAYDSGSMRDDRQALDAYALYLARFVEAYRDAGIDIEAVHVQNEPAEQTRYPSCFWSPELIRDFARDHLGPLFESRQVPAGIWLGTLDTADLRYATVVLGDEGARRHIRGIGVQWRALEITLRLFESYPDLPLMQTETVCGNHPWEPGFNPDRPPNDHAYGALTFWRILAFLKAGVRSYMAWNMVLDTEGKNLDSERPWPQNALLVVDREAGLLHETPAYFAFRHFSGIVETGATRIGLTGAFEDAVAFRNPDGRLIVVLLNEEGRQRTLTIDTRDAVLELDLPAYGWATVTY